MKIFFGGKIQNSADTQLFTNLNFWDKKDKISELSCWSVI